jgi:hypothetical protein
LPGYARDDILPSYLGSVTPLKLIRWQQRLLNRRAIHRENAHKALWIA